MRATRRPDDSRMREPAAGRTRCCCAPSGTRAETAASTASRFTLSDDRGLSCTGDVVVSVPGTGTERRGLFSSVVRLARAPVRPLQSAPMRLRRLSEAAVEERGRLRSHFLMDAGDLGSRNLTVTWVDVPPGAEQRAHSHEEAEQVYVIVRGHGRMQVAGDVQEVGEGDLIFIPPATQHGIGTTAPRPSCTSRRPRRPSRWPSCTATSCRRTATATTTTDPAFLTPVG